MKEAWRDGTARIAHAGSFSAVAVAGPGAAAAAASVTGHGWFQRMRSMKEAWRDGTPVKKIKMAF